MKHGNNYVAASPQRCLAHDGRGNVAIIVALTAMPVIVAIGAGVDISRVARAKATLQNAADAAALAGAAIYTTSGQNINAQNSAKSYFSKYAQGSDSQYQALP